MNNIISFEFYSRMNIKSNCNDIITLIIYLKFIIIIIMLMLIQHLQFLSIRDFFLINKNLCYLFHLYTFITRAN